MVTKQVLRRRWRRQRLGWFFEVGPTHVSLSTLLFVASIVDNNAATVVASVADNDIAVVVVASISDNITLLLQTIA